MSAGEVFGDRLLRLPDWTVRAFLGLRHGAMAPGHATGTGIVMTSKTDKEVQRTAEASALVTNNVHVKGFRPLPTPREVRKEIPASAKALETVTRGRDDIRDSLNGKNQRLMIVVGPCSIHDVEAGLDYARRLAELRNKVSDRLIIVMRVYFEKPRTTVGWKGLINDPHLDGSHDIARGVMLARKLLLDVNEMQLPCATEFLDPIVPQYTSDLVSWAAIGARTTESQRHREMASGLSMPVGFKNATDGLLEPAINAMASSRQAHTFLGIDDEGHSAIVCTSGNPDVHIVLRGGGGRKNYMAPDIAYAKVALGEADGSRPLLVDCSHDNSDKDPNKQPDVFRCVLDQYVKGQKAILGVMLESNIIAGRQECGQGMEYGKSITDPCIDWATTEELILEAHAALK